MNPEQLGEKRECYLYAIPSPFNPFFIFQHHFIDTFYDMVLELHKSDLSSGATYIAPKIRCRQERATNDSSEFTKEDLIEFLPTVEVSFWPDEVSCTYGYSHAFRMFSS